MLKKIEDGFEIYIEDLLVLKHTVNEPAIYLGNKNINISMKNGDFDIMDQTTYYPLTDCKIFNNQVVFLELTIEFIKKKDGLHLKLLNSDKPLRIKVSADKEENIFGCGEHFTDLNLRGHVVKNWVEEHITRKQIYNKIIRRIFKLKPKRWKFEDYKTYFITPTYISSKNYFFHAETDGYGTLDFTNESYHQLTFLNMPKELIVEKKTSLLELSGALAKQRGIMPELPDWIYDGMILAIQGGTKVCDDKVTNMLEKGAKINGIWSQDWCGELFTFFGKQVLWNWKVSDELYPNLKEYIDKWNKLGVKFLTYINPYLNANESMFEYAKKNNYLVMNDDETPFLTKATSFDFGIVDLTNQKAYDWYKSIIKENYLKIGIMGWMADFGEYLPFDCNLKNGSGEVLHNPWPDLWVKLNREALEETNMLNKAVFFNRAGYKDSVKYTTLIWNGDQHVDYTDDFGMASALRAKLSLSLSGVGISHSDIGGYTTVPGIKRSKELFIRWLEMNTFTPVLRGHEGNKPWVNAQFDSDEELVQATVKFSNIHAMLKPYLKEVENEYHNFGYPMIRPTFMYSDFYSEKSFYLGSDIYVVPIMKKHKKIQKVVIPKGIWVHIFTGKEYHKGDYEISVPLGTPTVFYKIDTKYIDVFTQITEFVKTTNL